MIQVSEKRDKKEKKNRILLLNECKMTRTNLVFFKMKSTMTLTPNGSTQNVRGTAL